jgi:putative phosphonate metabolism protein
MSDWRRHAIYFAPAAGSALARFGAEWFGSDPESGEARDGPVLSNLAARRTVLTAVPRRYGFHATLKPPFALAEGTDLAGLDAATTEIARRQARFAVRDLRIAELGCFLALVPMEPSQDLAALADACVTELDAFRSPAGAAEIDRRRTRRLDVVEEAHLLRWGYPYVLDRFVFHMTLTGPLEPDVRLEVRAALEAELAPILAEALPVAEICRFSEAPDGFFHLVRRFPLG